MQLRIQSTWNKLSKQDDKTEINKRDKKQTKERKYCYKTTAEISCFQKRVRQLHQGEGTLN